jgi:hypothetical protein
VDSQRKCLILFMLNVWSERCLLFVNLLFLSKLSIRGRMGAQLGNVPALRPGTAPGPPIRRKKSVRPTPTMLLSLSSATTNRDFQPEHNSHQNEITEFEMKIEIRVVF